MLSLRGRRISFRSDSVSGVIPIRLSSDALEIQADFKAGSAAAFGLLVRRGANEETRIGYDAKAAEVLVDRRRSSAVAFHPDFAGRHAAPLALRDGRVSLHVLVDRSSVEVFAGLGQAVITDRIYPAPESHGVAVWAEGGAASLASLEAWPLE